MNILKYEAICNLGNSIDEIFHNAISGKNDCFEISKNIIKGKKVRIAKINAELSEIKDEKFNTRCNRLILTCLEKMNFKNFVKQIGKENIAVVVATTNSGVEEYEKSGNIILAELGNPALFVKNYYNLKNYFACVSTACSSGIKAFSLAEDLLNSNFAKAVIVIGVDAISKVPVFGFNSLEILTSNKTNPFGENRNGINIGEAVAAFLVTLHGGNIEIAGIGENTDIYHNTTPNPNATEEIKAIYKALKNAKTDPTDIDYINLHGTGTYANDLMEAVAVSSIFDNIYASSTKPLTGHCLGAAASIETALCAKMLEDNNKKIYPHIYEGVYDKNLPKIKLALKNCKCERLKTCLCLSFGFGGANAAMVIRKKPLNLAEILPHKPPMILIDDIINVDLEGRSINVKFIVNDKKMFYDKQAKGIPSICGIELCAQAIGCFAYFANSCKRPEIGFLLGSRLYNNSIEYFKLNETYTIFTKEIYTDNKISAFDCIIYDSCKNEIASTTINVYQDENIRKVIKSNE